MVLVEFVEASDSVLDNDDVLALPGDIVIFLPSFVSLHHHNSRHLHHHSQHSSTQNHYSFVQSLSKQVYKSHCSNHSHLPPPTCSSSLS
mmetsp:Transcript_2624/g.10040  ORF Transcript_2624/g.10040 Transcript_2624/m.10040 type:complete len:89 (-) Transcript_2624:2123-2389(-)